LDYLKNLKTNTNRQTATEDFELGDDPYTKE